MNTQEYKLLLAISIVTFIVRCYRLGSPPSVVFDEVHFGGQVSKYIKQRFFMDVHPPLAKLLLTAAAAIFGFNGNFSFEHIGDDYVVHDVPYIAMRAVPALLGVALTPLTYLICRSLQLKPISALLGSLLITFENALATQSRLILLDSPLVFFTALSTYSFIKFYNQNKSKTAHFTQEWWSWLFLTGLSLGAVLSVKWVGLFTVATIGVATVYQLWELLGNLSIPPRLLFKHFTTRALCLIVIPILFYLWMFAIHLSILNRSGGGDTFMSAAFQHSLRGNRLQDTYAPVGMGSEVSIRHLHSTGGYLHSHEHDYPTGSFQQQITLYPYTDDNNIWQIVERSDNNGEPDHHDYHNEKFRQIYNGAVIRLMHLDTGKRLHSHDHKPPVSEAEFQNEVSGYGFEGFNGDANDNFKIEIVNGDSRDPSSYKELKAIKTHFRLKHVLSGCYLFSHKEKLPEWGYGQQEVTCNKQSPLENSIWYVEVNSHGQLEDNENVEMVNYRPMGFLEKFYELQSVMWDVNNGLLERHAFDSRPMSWPLFLRGINFWVKDHKQIYLIGNPVVWWLGFVAILGSGAYLGLLTLRNKRGYSDFDASTRHYTLISSFVASGWALHYIPFFLMERQLFIHHYLPALFYSIVMISVIFDLLTNKLRSRIRFQLAGLILIVAMIVYFKFSPLMYGLEWTNNECEKSKWLSSWDFACQQFPSTYDDYAQYKDVLQENIVEPANDIFEELQSKASDNLAQST
ncbi:glycosyltransferase family 39 protein [Wallemia mellicola]|nr:glycosyltransferase family 39 protein [Wallemia mellicola]TIC26790.1 glycosyltransferase family 39 protein [Wallemia mellicola]TIC45745.1 glycosyltransferase family 39 protein [Wallemia mellicola]TIC58534.1 glycosyltransferase family 39 protein [Wallemia mellicola]